MNQSGTWDEGEVLTRDTPNTEAGQFGKATLKAGQRYRLRLDHSIGMPRPVLILTVTRPGKKERIGIDQFLELP